MNHTSTTDPGYRVSTEAHTAQRHLNINSKGRAYRFPGRVCEKRNKIKKNSSEASRSRKEKNHIADIKLLGLGVRERKEVYNSMVVFQNEPKLHTLSKDIS